MTAILSVLVVIAIWRFALYRNGKGTLPGRFALVLSAIIIGWVLLVIKAPGVADGAPGAFASGIGRAATGLGDFLSRI